MRLFTLVVGVIAAMASDVSVPMDDFVRVRCSTDGTEAFYTWQGQMYLNVPGAAPKALFDVVGMNAARCLKDKEGNWYMTSREIEFYLHREDGTLLHSWANPLTGQNVTVVHCANDPVQNTFGPPSASIPADITNGQLVISSVIPEGYANPLYANATFRPYAPQPVYSALENFVFSTGPTINQSLTSVPATIAWTRNSQPLPWMGMWAGEVGAKGGLEGLEAVDLDAVSLTTTAKGGRVTWEELPAVVRDTITQQIPLFRHAPSTWEEKPNDTSWLYFGRHFADYLAGAVFPLPG